MLRIYDDVLDLLEAMRPVVREIERKDGDLARQTRRASASVALNLAEGAGSQGGNRRTRYHSALGSARETLACFDVARRLYGVEATDGLRDELDKIIATLFNLTR